MTKPFDRVALIGIGLIGSSLAHAMRKHKLAGEITGYARSEATRAKAMEIGLVDKVRSPARRCNFQARGVFGCCRANV